MNTVQCLIIDLTMSDSHIRLCSPKPPFKVVKVEVKKKKTEEEEEEEEEEQQQQQLVLHIILLQGFTAY
jgi:hypothetical protein